MMKTIKAMIKTLYVKLKATIKTHSTKRIITVGVFIVLTPLLIVHSLILTLFYIDNNYHYTIYDVTYIEAILPNQDTTQPMRTGIVRIREFTFDEITTDDQIVMCCDFGTDKNFVHYVESYNNTNRTLETSYTKIVANEVLADDVFGIYEKDANLFGTIYYTAMFTQGYILLLLSHLLLGLGYYYIFIFDNPDRFFQKDMITSDKKVQKKRVSQSIEHDFY